MSGCIINRLVWHLTASEVMVSSPLGRRLSASGSPEHVLVPTADCPEDISHIIQPNQGPGLTQRPEHRQLEIEYSGDVSQMKLNCHSVQMGHKTEHNPYKDTTFPMQTRSSNGTDQHKCMLTDTY